jgi:hypothetical protein
LVLLEDYRVVIILGIFKINENIYVHVEVKPIIEKKHKNFNIISKDEKEDRIFYLVLCLKNFHTYKPKILIIFMNVQTVSKLNKVQISLKSF